MTLTTRGKHRHGTLCSRCKPGYSEALLSTKCIPNRKCNQIWFLPMTVALACLYALFLMFQNNLKNYVLGVPIGKQIMKKTFTDWMNARANRKCKAEPKIVSAAQFIKSEQGALQEATQSDEGGIFFILIFYYFQDAAFVHFSPIYAEAIYPLIAVLKKFVGGLFKFQLDILLFADNICPFPGLNPVSKILLKLLFVPSVLTVLIVIYLFSKLRLRKLTVAKKWEDIHGKASVATMLAILFSYQKLSSSVFALVYCVPVEDETILFIEGSVKCLQGWQMTVLFYIYLCIVPFEFYIVAAPSFRKSHKITIGQYFLGCLMPIPVVVFKIVTSYLFRVGNKGEDDQGKTSESGTTDVCLVYGMLQGPYKEYHIPLPHIRHVPLCWSGILLIKRLCLIITYTYAPNILLRLLLMTLISFLSFLHHLMVKPCKENRANVAGTVSCAALLCLYH